nr:MAG TPA: hypothetical protein [Caudoviricetes sp.]
MTGFSCFSVKIITSILYFVILIFLFSNLYKPSFNFFYRMVEIILAGFDSLIHHKKNKIMCELNFL